MDVSGKKNQDEASLINFRPSPNFKHMKKYLKSKFEEDMNSGTSVPENNIDQNNKVITAMQPPLPPNSPPPDSPPGFTVKQEVEDEEYERAERGDAGADDAGAPGPGAAERRVMCKDFVRGMCMRGAACIYMHELDVTQLENVYRFCRDFENNRCVRPVCYFVHATTFEKEHFMRTGSLPAHATAHMPNRAAAAPAAPPPHPAAPPAPAAPAVPAVPAVPAPPQPHPTDIPAELAPLFANAPAAALGSGAAACAGAGALEARLPLGALPALPTVAAMPAQALKREWRDVEPFSSPPRDLDSNEPLAKKCNHCDYTELRLKTARAQLAGARRASLALDEKLDKLDKSSQRLHAVLKALLKPKRMDNNNFLSGNRLSMLDSDGNKEVLLSQMKVLLAKLLLSPDGLASGSGGAGS